MRVLILGGDGYLGWPTAKYLADKGHDVTIVDNYSKRFTMVDRGIKPLFDVATMGERTAKTKISSYILEAGDDGELHRMVKAINPDAIIHYAEQPSAPYSMMGEDEGMSTVVNNISTNMRLIYAVLQHNPAIHIIKLGTMGEYGTPNTQIPEGWFDCEYRGRSDRMLFPKKPHSIYHLSKVHDSDALAFACRVWGLRVTDLNQGFVYGHHSDTRFTYDAVFGTVLNRFITQAVAGIPLTVYGKGGQTRGALHIKDTLQCVELALENPAKPSEFRVFNQFTEQFSVNKLAAMVQNVTGAQIEHIENPRDEMEDHFYQAEHKGLLELGLTPHYLTDERLESMVEYV